MEGHKGPVHKCEQLCDRKVMEERSLLADKGRSQRGKLIRGLTCHLGVTRLSP